ncbi:ABC transporter permease [Dethiosulfatarculus sandiegensis]|uniref:ABC transporter permease n=1 Tax=Dethiosulfatarculus sandiegensis TaxID=1429043 RepID=A0A0D2JVN4_9BACT|nr:ABC transporter permease [Dethiosulfatarculus sandiegensis]KIX13645.1 ABC transporter permease [Dethiosulfatarculus sandiegensis]
MKGLWAIYLKEMAFFFRSPIVYVLLAGFLLLTGFFFYSQVSIYSLISRQMMHDPMLAGMNLQRGVVQPLLGNIAMILILLAPLVCMRLLSEEKKNGTLELLLSYPVSDTSVIGAKFLAAWTVLGLAVFLTGLYLLLLGAFGKLNPAVIATGYLGLLLLAAGFSAVGVLASAATENQIIASGVSFALLLLFWTLGQASQAVSPFLQPLFREISLGSHLEPFLQGVIDTKDLAFFLFFTWLFLFTAVRILESKRWKGWA